MIIYAIEADKTANYLVDENGKILDKYGFMQAATNRGVVIGSMSEFEKKFNLGELDGFYIYILL